MNSKKLAALFAIIGASVAVSLAIQRHAGIRLRQGADSLNQQAEALAELSDGNKRLTELTERLKGTEPLTKAQLTELLRLRGQVLAARSYEARELVEQHAETPPQRWEVSPRLPR